MKELFLNLKQKINSGKNVSIVKNTSLSKYYDYAVVTIIVFTIGLLVFNIFFLNYIRHNMAFQSVDEVHAVPKINEKKLGTILDRYSAKVQEGERVASQEVPSSDPSK